MLHAGLDLSRRKLDVCLLGDDGEHLDQLAVAPDPDSLRQFARRIEEVHRQPVCAVIESMTGARIVHDTPRAAGLVGGDRRRPEGQGPGAAGLQDRQDRLSGLGDAQPPRPGAGDLAARPEREDPARARPLSPPPGQAQIGAQESDPLDPDQLRPAPPGHRSVRGRGPPAARAPRAARAVAGEHHRLARPDRRPRRPDRRGQRPAAGGPRRAPLHPPADQRPEDRLRARLHDRRRDRRDRALLKP